MHLAHEPHDDCTPPITLSQSDSRINLKLPITEKNTIELISVFSRLPKEAKQMVIHRNQKFITIISCIFLAILLGLAMTACQKTTTTPPTPATVEATAAPSPCAHFPGHDLFTDGHVFNYAIHIQEVDHNRSEPLPDGWTCDSEGKCIGEHQYSATCKTTLTLAREDHCTASVSCTSDLPEEYAENWGDPLVHLLKGNWHVDANGLYFIGYAEQNEMEDMASPDPTANYDLIIPWKTTNGIVETRDTPKAGETEGKLIKTENVTHKDDVWEITTEMPDMPRTTQYRLHEQKGFTSYTYTEQEDWLIHLEYQLK